MLIKEWALRYLDRGWSVVPANPKTKSPCIKWEAYQERLPTKDEVHKWFTQWPNANLGVITGKVSNMTVLDHDVLEKSVPCKSAVFAQSGSGKYHYFFKFNPLAKTISKKAELGYDFRSEGGFIVLAPSLHESGGSYRWLCDYRLPLPPLGDEFIPGEMQKIDGLVKPKGWEGDILLAMQNGNIDETIFTVLSKWRNEGWSAEQAYEVLQPFAVSRGAEEGHVRDKIENVWNRYEPKKSVVVENEEAESVEKFLESDEKVTWIVPGLLAKNSIAFVVGLPESGKTWLSMDLAIEAALGGNWLGLFTVAPTKTLFIDQERFSGETRRRFRALISSKGAKAPGKDTLFVKCGSSIKLDLEHSYNAFVRLLDKIRPELVIIDSLATIHTKEENSRSEIQSVMEKVKQLRQQFGCTFVFISHSNKFAFQAAKEGQEPGIAEMAGSIALPAAAETVLTVQRAKGGGSTVYHSKSTLSAKLGPFGVLVEDVPGGIKVRGVK